MGFLEKTDVRSLMRNGKLLAEIAKSIVENGDALDDLAGDIADKLADSLENDPGLKEKIIRHAMSRPEFKQRVVQRLVAALG